MSQSHPARFLLQWIEFGLTFKLISGVQAFRSKLSQLACQVIGQARGA